MNRDLTEGNVTKSLLYFATLMILGNLLQQCYNIADTWVVGKYVGAQTALVMIGVLAVTLSIVVQCLLHPILLLLRTPGELYEMTRDYLVIVFCGIFFIYLYNYYAFLLRASLLR